jgi:hypothetical protein
MYLGGINLISHVRNAAPTGIALMLIFGALGVLFLSLFASFCLLLIGGVPLPAALAHMAVREKLGAAFNVFEWGAVLAGDRWGYFISWVVVAGLATLIQFAIWFIYSTLILCAVAYVVIVPLGFYLMLVAAAVFAQSYREGLTHLRAATPAGFNTPVQEAEAQPGAADMAESI